MYILYIQVYALHMRICIFGLDIWADIRVYVHIRYMYGLIPENRLITVRKLYSQNKKIYFIVPYNTILY